ncbi:tyrosine-type recombinase/integrase [Microbacterium aurum]
MVKSREHGQGALYWDVTKNAWRVVIDAGYDPKTGKRIQRARQSKTKDGAMRKLNQMLRERESMGRVLDRATRVGELAEAWLNDAATRTKPKTITGYRSNVKSKIVPTLGRKLVSDLTPADVRRLHTAIRQKGGGDASVASTHRTLVTMLEYARAERMISENVAMLTPPRRTVHGKARDSLSRDDARKLLALEDPRWTLGLLTGLRSGEARGLRWEDIDLGAGVATLAWSLTEASFTHGCGGSCGRKRAGNCPSRQLEVADDLEWELLQDRHVLVRPKNDTPRQVPLTPSMTTQLLKLRTAERGENPHGLVWHRSDGSPKTNTDDNNDLRAALVAAGISEPTATTHWLRHSYVTLSEHAGIPWAAFAGVSGHGTSEASDPYRHVLTDEGRRAVEVLAKWVEEDTR